MEWPIRKPAMAAKIAAGPVNEAKAAPMRAPAKPERFLAPQRRTACQSLAKVRRRLGV